MKNTKSREIAAAGILAAVMFVLSYLDSFLSAGLPPGMRFGLANTAVFIALVILSERDALLLTLAKCLFVFITRGAVAAAMSLSGSIPAVIIMIILFRKTSASFVFICAAAAVLHAAGQIICAACLTESVYTLYFTPILLVSSVITGTVTGIISSKVITIIPKIEKEKLSYGSRKSHSQS
ncbi:MAG: Gx transporter family protein [Ruminococcus sp.]|jgi:heptaprenyl diphosphate synthase|nr:Gx transporter family protein [Ruminococcus sp.]